MEDRLEEETRAVPEERDSPSRVDVGSKVNAIIEAAEAAAEEIGQDARREASGLMRKAEQDAAARIEELTREASRLRAEADQYARDISEAADSYGTQHRRTVEKEARLLVTDAE